MRNSLSKQLILLLTTVFIVEVFFIGLAAVIGQSVLKKMQEEELKTYVTSLPPLVSQSLILQKINGNDEAFEFLIYEIIQTRKLNYAGFFLEKELKSRVMDDKRYRSCEKFLTNHYCNPADFDLALGITPLEFEGRLVGYVLQEASRSQFTSNLDPSVIVNLGLSLVVAFILNIIAVLFFFRTKVSKNLEGIQKLIQDFNQDRDLPKELNSKINLTEFEEIATTLKLAHEIRRENLRTRDVKIQADTLMSTVQMIAHDVRRPFSLLTMSLNSLTNIADSGELRSHLVRLKDEVSGSTALVNSMLDDLLEVGRKTTDEFGPINLLLIVVESIAEISRLHAYPDIPITWDCNDNQWVIGEQRLQRVVVNIVANAVEATKACMHLHIKISAAKRDVGEMIMLEIKNTGSFIESTEQEKIFDLFHTQGKSGGTGLGLAIARRIIDNHGGSITCSSENQTPSTTFHIMLPKSSGSPSLVKLPGNFTAFKLDTPRYLMASKSECPGTTEENPLKVFFEREKRKAVLVLVDDDIFYREFSSQLLTTHPQIGAAIEMHSLDNLSDLDHFKSPYIDILFCDLNFGKGAAVEADTLLELRKRFPKTIILLHSDDEWRGRELQKSGYVFFPKPLDAEKFLQAVTSINVKTEINGE